MERLSNWEVLDEPRRLRPGETLRVTAELYPGSVDMARRIIGSRLVSVEEGEGFSTLTVAYDREKTFSQGC